MKFVYSLASLTLLVAVTYANCPTFQTKDCTGDGNYCRMYDDNPVCFLPPNEPCAVPVTNCGPGSYCKDWLQCPVCHGSNIPCTTDPNAPASGPAPFTPPDVPSPPGSVVPGGATVVCGEGSYCMLESVPHVCHGSNIPCQPPVTNCGLGDWCKFDAIPVPHCQHSGLPCIEPKAQCGSGSYCKPMHDSDVTGIGVCQGTDTLCWMSGSAPS
jgi:hypothetical protein